MTREFSLLGLAAIPGLSASAPSAHAENIVFPPGSGVADVQAQDGAKGDGLSPAQWVH